MSFELNLLKGTYIDFAVGTVIKGKEMQVFTEYFPLIRPALEALKIQTLLPFIILDTNTSGPIPEQGALTQVSSPDNFAKFHEDPRFIQAKPLRDEAMTFLNDGNFFHSRDCKLSLETDTDYAFILSSESTANIEPIISLQAAENSPQKRYEAKSVMLTLWSDEAEQLLANKHTDALVFKVRFPSNQG
ncbi:hypothetical protein TW85_23310 [Marinomonas sp. S3726]|uniref:hypothetical protein n=1 Tax=Marinomonas sp. S3726 TaxID=579484 RepID=UPI0005FA48A8|nr:hypothetical protein [Marinomonas sp. S3726]KJZ08691.1 hypothetical protein TW85_23310 [Marinomonas sp. S3726]